MPNQRTLNVPCKEHGIRPAVLVCRHLISRPSMKWFPQPATGSEVLDDFICGPCADESDARRDGGFAIKERLLAVCDVCCKNIMEAKV